MLTDTYTHILTKIQSQLSDVTSELQSASNNKWKSEKYFPPKKKTSGLSSWSGFSLLFHILPVWSRLYVCSDVDVELKKNCVTQK